MAEPELERPLVDKPPATRASNGRLVETGGFLGFRKAQEGPTLPSGTPPRACWSSYHGVGTAVAGLCLTAPPPTGAAANLVAAISLPCRRQQWGGPGHPLEKAIASYVGKPMKHPG